MRIQKINIAYLNEGGFYAVETEGVTHTKVLPYLSVVQSLTGSYDISLGNEAPQQTGAGGFFIAPANIKQTIVHHVCPESGTMSARWLFLDVEINGAHRLDELFRFPTVIKKEDGAALHALFDRFFETDSIWEKYTACHAVLEFLMTLAEPLPVTEHHGAARALAYMTRHYAQPISIEALAQVACMSPSTLFATFKKQFGLSPLSYLNHYRLSLAAEKLSDSTLSVAEIALSVGMNDALYFSKLFKRAYGASPRAYRLMHGKHSSP